MRDLLGRIGRKLDRHRRWDKRWWYLRGQDRQTDGEVDLIHCCTSGYFGSLIQTVKRQTDIQIDNDPTLGNIMLAAINFPQKGLLNAKEAK